MDTIKVMAVRFKRLHEKAILPKYAHGPTESAAMDLYSIREEEFQQGYIYRIPTGLAVEIPPGLEGQIRCRSSMAARGFIVANSPGTIDPGYRGEICILLRWIPEHPEHEIIRVKEGERIAQLLVAPYVMVNPEWAEEINETKRGEGGFGSTGR